MAKNTQKPLKMVWHLTALGGKTALSAISACFLLLLLFLFLCDEQFLLFFNALSHTCVTLLVFSCLCFVCQVFVTHLFTFFILVYEHKRDLLHTIRKSMDIKQGSATFC